MRPLRTAILAGMSAAVLAGVALAATSDRHVMHVALPDGGAADISYVGKIPPIVHVRDPMRHENSDPFATMDRITGRMDMQAARMLQQAADGADAAPRDLPPGAIGYSYVVTHDGDTACMREIRMLSSVSGGRPTLVSSQHGDCGRQAAAVPGKDAPMHITSAAKTPVPVDRRSI